MQTLRLPVAITRSLSPRQEAGSNSPAHAKIPPAGTRIARPPFPRTSARTAHATAISNGYPPRPTPHAHQPQHRRAVETGEEVRNPTLLRLPLPPTSGGLVEGGARILRLRRVAPRLEVRRGLEPLLLAFHCPLTLRSCYPRSSPSRPCVQVMQCLRAYLASSAIVTYYGYVEHYGLSKARNHHESSRWQAKTACCSTAADDRRDGAHELTAIRWPRSHIDNVLDGGGPTTAHVLTTAHFPIE
jgi:hypothetical protein